MKDHLRQQLIRDEGIRLKPYRDTVGKLTIGVGRNLDDVGISQDEADLMLDGDINRTIATLRQKFAWFDHLSVPRQVVIANMAFNLGIDGLSKFRRMLKAIEDKDYIVAAREMLDSGWSNQVGSRAKRLAKQMETDSF